MTETTLTDISENVGNTTVSGRDTIQNIIIGGVDIQDIISRVSPAEIPTDSPNERLEAGLESSRQLLKKSKRKLALLILEGDRNSENVVTAVRNIKMFGENILNLIGLLSLRGVACEHLPNEGNYLDDINKIWHIKNTMKDSSYKHSCPHCKNRLKIRVPFPNKEMMVIAKKPKKTLLLFDSCTKYKDINDFKICRTETMYCHSCKNPICTYFALIANSMHEFVNVNYPV